MHGRIAAFLVTAVAGLTLPATASGALFVVTAAGDAGPGTLRQAIVDANANGNPAEVDIVVFSAALTPPITLTSPITATQPVSIQSLEETVTVQTAGDHDGLVFAAGAAGSQVFAVDDADDDGALLFSGFGTALSVAAADVDIIDLAVDDSSGDGIAIAAAGATVDGVLISDSGGDGIDVSAAGASISDTRVTGSAAWGVRLDQCATLVRNTIGLDALGVPAPNGDGVRSAGSNCIIGSAAAGQGNVISGNDGAGLVVAGSDAAVHDNTIEDNTGVGVSLEASGALVGGNAPGAANRINDNGSHGIALAAGVTGTDIVGNQITGNGGSGVFVPATAVADISANSISGNAAIGIDTDGTPGAPTIAAAAVGAASTEVRVTWPAVAGSHRIEIFRSTTCPPPGGVGEVLVDTVTVASASAGTATITRTIGQAIPVGQHVTATVTFGGQTSEFSTCKAVTAVPSLAFASADVPASEGGNATLTVTRTGDLSAGSTVQYATAPGTAAAGTDYSSATGTLTFAAGDASETITVPVAQDEKPELAETFTVTLSSPTGATLDAPSTATVTIAQSDFADLTVTASGSVNDGVCNAAHCTLAEAITLANADADRDPIVFLDGLVATLTLAPPLITQPVSLVGPAAIALPAGTSLSIAAGSAATPTQILAGVTITGDGPAVVVANGAHALIQGSTLAGVTFAAGSAGTLGGAAGAGNVITTAGDAVVLGAGADVGVSRNTITSTAGDGVRVASTLARVFDNTISGGLVLESCGDAQVITGNTVDGVTISAAGCQLGGSGADDGNTVTGAPGAGVTVAAGDTDVIGNTITANGGDGVRVTGGAGSRIIGNTISGNAGDGVRLDGGSALIRDNAITANGGLGIDAGADGADGLRAAVGSAVDEAGGLRVKGTIPADAAGQYELEFAANDACDASGAGEGANPLGVVAVAVAAPGSASFDVLLDVDVAVGQAVAVTITRAGVTGEYSGCATVSGPPGGGAGPGPGPGPGPGVPDPEFDPRSAITAPLGTRRARRVKAIRGTAADAERVQVAVTRKGARCKALTANGRLKRRACSRPRYLEATGTATWKLRLKQRLPAGRYVIRSRAIAPDGSVETTPAKVKVRLRA
jgi:parallel beta-helix repeat protein